MENDVNALSKPLALAAPLALVLATAVPNAAAAAPGDAYPYDQPGDTRFMTNTNVIERYTPTGAGNNQSHLVQSSRAEADAAFTTLPITVDGARDEAWDTATAYPIDNRFNAAMTADAPTATTEGTVRLLWDGPVLYALVEVTGDTTKSDTGTANWNTAAYTPNTDGLFVSMDVFNDQLGVEGDTQGVFFRGANPAAAPTSFNNGGIPSLGSFFNPNNQDYSTRLQSAEQSGYVAGEGVNYTYEIALQIEGWGDAAGRELTNGTQVGLEFGVFDQGQSFTYWSKTEVFAGREGNSNLPNSERVRNRDWGVATLKGWDEKTPFAYSGWSADETVRFWNSKNNPGGSGTGLAPTDDGDDSTVWTPESKARFVAAKAAWLTIRSDANASRAQKEAAIREVQEAWAALRWADTRFPDPRDLPSEQTIPNAFRFFDPSKGTNGMVTTAAQWEERKAEILDLAQFYEYGFKPQLGQDYTVELVSNTYTGSGNAQVIARVVPTNARWTGGQPVNITINVALPTAVPGGGKAAISFGAATYTANGFANIGLPNWAFDSRTDAGAWGNPNRSGTFYTLFPYQRNSTAHDSSILIANTTGFSAILDALHLAVDQNPALDAKIDPSLALTKGFSINGKIAFVGALFDERIKWVVAGGAGATGPANWRYNAQGQRYDFTGTPFAAPGAENVIAHGTEGPGNSYRHNRVRETELFRHFLPYGHEYAHEEGSYSYGSYDNLPFDQSLLVATLAPERGIIIDTNLNDFNDGATTDNMSLQLAKSVYANLGLDADRFVKFNSGNYISSGDPHGVVNPALQAKYLSDVFYGTESVTADEAGRLDLDPFALPVSDGRTQNPYDYYWGGYNTITGGSTGVDGADGWYFFGVDAEIQSLRNAVAALGLNGGNANALNKKIDQVVKAIAKGKTAQAIDALQITFLGQVEGFRAAARISDIQAAKLNEAVQQLVLYLNTSN
jgi:hypothetical protein